MTAFQAIAVTAGTLAYAAASSAFVGYRMGPMVRKLRRGENNGAS